METPSSEAENEDIPGYLAEYAVTSLECVHEEDFESALAILKRSEKLLERQARASESDPVQVLLTLHNTACCFQRYFPHRLQRLEEAAAYLNGCAYNLKTHALPPNSPQEAVINRLRYRCRCHTQLCGLLSQLRKHEAALHHAEKSLKFAENCIQETLSTAQMALRHRVKTPLAELASRWMPLLEHLLARLHPTRERPSVKPKRLDMRTVLGVQNYAEWIYAYDISDVMRIEATTIEQLRHSFGVEIELTQTLLLEKVCLLAAACFCVASETRFIASAAGGTQRRDLARTWHLKAVHIADDFLPLECPLSGHLKQTFLQCYGDSLRRVKKDSSLSRYQANISVKSPSGTSKIARQLLSQTRSTSAKTRRRPSPRRPEPSPKPRPAQSDKRLPKCTPKIVKTARKDEERPKGAARIKPGRSTPALKDQVAQTPSKQELDSRPSTRQISPLSPLEDDQDSSSDSIRLTSNQLYGLASPTGSLSPCFEERKPTAAEADKLRQVSSTGGRS